MNDNQKVMTRTGHRAFPLAGGLALVGMLVLVSPQPAPEASSPLWLAPASSSQVPTPVAIALQQAADGKHAAALPALQAAASAPVVGTYVRVHQGRAELALDRPAEALASARAALAVATTSYAKERALWLAADAAEATTNWAAAAEALSALVALPSGSPAQALFRFAAASEQLGQTRVAADAYARVHFEFPLSDEAAQAADDFAILTAPLAPKALARAQALFAARRYADARKAYDSVRPHVTGDERDLVTLRLAQLDFHQRRLPAAQEALRAYLNRSAIPAGRRDEAEYFVISTTREQGRHADYVAAVRDFVDRVDRPDSVWAESALNDLGTHHILTDAEPKAAEVFTEQYDRFPTGSFAGRAAWKAGWWAFSTGNYAETIRLFESAAAGLRRSDYRSGWVYWAARAHERLGHRDQAVAGYERTIGYYGNSYYGREAARARETLLAAMRPAGAGPVEPVRRSTPLIFEPGPAPTTASLIQSLLEAQLWDDAIGEIRRAQRDEGVTPLLEATLAYAYNRRGDLRLAISAMKRAYPEYLADGSEDLPRELLTVVFPLAYWDLIQSHADAHDLDPFLIAALMAQESTFDPKIRSAANAWGLMQILPSTGARVARQLKIQPFNTASLTRPEINVRLGTQYFADLVRRYGGDVAPALAAYNAGENRVDRWRTERPGLDRDEFVDSIPFPETQGYVKKILGTAEDYRALYRRTTPRR
jgi:soluble lytic murein transglycosylase